MVSASDHTETHETETSLKLKSLSNRLTVKIFTATEKRNNNVISLIDQNRVIKVSALLAIYLPKHVLFQAH